MKINRVILWITIFSIAMGFMEAAVVIYLRALYYPEGFSFPLMIIDYNIAITEFIREIATIIMLAGAGILAGKKNIERFAFFIFSFAVWDIFYYIFLKFILNWPDSFFTWDILFMVPVTWVGPVLAPVINSLTMVFLAGSILFILKKNEKVKIGVATWALLILGSGVIIFSYTKEYISYMLGRFSFSEMLGVSGNKDILKYACSFIPQHFNWYIFGIGFLMHIAAIFGILFKNKFNSKN